MQKWHRNENYAITIQENVTTTINKIIRDERTGPYLLQFIYFFQQFIFNFSPHILPPVIYVARNPKDTAVSLFHHAKSKPEFGYTGDFNTFCEIFLAGTYV